MEVPAETYEDNDPCPVKDGAQYAWHWHHIRACVPSPAKYPKSWHYATRRLCIGKCLAPNRCPSQSFFVSFTLGSRHLGFASLDAQLSCRLADFILMYHRCCLMATPVVPCTSLSKDSHIAQYCELPSFPKRLTGWLVGG